MTATDVADLDLDGMTQPERLNALAGLIAQQAADLEAFLRAEIAQMRANLNEASS